MKAIRADRYLFEAHDESPHLVFPKSPSWSLGTKSSDSSGSSGSSGGLGRLGSSGLSYAEQSVASAQTPCSPIIGVGARPEPEPFAWESCPKGLPEIECAGALGLDLPDGFFEFAQRASALDLHAAAVARALAASIPRIERADGPTAEECPAVAMVAAAARLRAAAGGDVYLADGLAFGAAALLREFPELQVFQLSLAEAFQESEACPGIWTETARFAALRSLSKMRRELRRTGARANLSAAAVVQALLGM